MMRVRPTHLFLAAVALLALPRLVGFWWNDPLFAFGLAVAPWAAWRVLREPEKKQAAVSSEDDASTDEEGERPADTGEDAPQQKAPALDVTFSPNVTGSGPRMVMGLAVAAGAAALLGLFYAHVYLLLVGLVGALAAHAADSGRLRAGLLPAGLLLISVPPPGFDPVLLRSQLGVAAASEHGLALLGTATTRDGFYVHTAANTYIVEPLCTGLSGVLATAALVGMAAEHLRPSWRRALVALGIGLGLTVLLNVARVVALVQVTESWGPKWIEGAFHGSAALVLSLLAFLPAAAVLVPRRPE